MSAFEVKDEEIFQQYLKKNIINGFLQKPIALSDLLDEVKIQIDQKNKWAIIHSDNIAKLPVTIRLL